MSAPSCTRWWRGRRLWVASLLAALTGCAVGPDFRRPPIPTVAHYTTEGEPRTTSGEEEQAQRFVVGAQVVPAWWRLFHSSTLDTIVTETLDHNPTLQAAQASVRKSQDLLWAGYGVFFPQGDAGMAATRQQFSPARFGSSAAPSLFNLFTLSTTVSYALDVFGSERRAVESLQAQVDVQQATVQATYLTLVGNIANTVIAQAAYGAQIHVTEELLRLEQEQLRITAVQAQAGTVPYATVLSLHSQLAAVEATLPLLQQKLEQTVHLLATLAGRAPAEWRLPPVALAELTLPQDLPVTLPSELVRQRPDILAAEAQLHRASAEVGVATAALFPSFVVSGTYGANSTSLASLFTSTSNFWSVGANLTTPLFHGGALWFQRKAAREDYQQCLATYRETVLSALAQVADTLRALDHDAATLQAQAQALAAAEGALRLVQVNYQAGVANYLHVLTADEQYRQATLGYVQALAQRLQDTVALFVALGGGWQDAEEHVPSN